MKGFCWNKKVEEFKAVCSKIIANEESAVDMFSPELYTNDAVAAQDEARRAELKELFAERNELKNWFGAYLDCKFDEQNMEFVREAEELLADIEHGRTK